MLSRTTRTLLWLATFVVCLAPAVFAQEPVAKVLDMSGQVSLLQGGYQKAISTGDTIRQMQVIVTGPDGWAKFQYTDGSTFEVFPKSQVIFREQPTDWEHLLNIIIGHVKVWIQHAPGVPNHKNVTTPTAVISVRGTVFDVNVEDDDGTTFIAVEEGVVGVRNLTAPGPVPELQAGESIHVFRNQPLVVQKDHGMLYNKLYRAAQEALYQVLLGHPGGIGGIGGVGGGVPTAGGGTVGAQGDKGKNGGSTGTGTAPAPPAPAPPPAPSGSGH
jgi:hypothetical protein